MSKLCVARNQASTSKHAALVPARSDASDGREDRTKIPIVGHRARFQQGSMPV